jgi:hypothetical protein
MGANLAIRSSRQHLAYSERHADGIAPYKAYRGGSHRARNYCYPSAPCVPIGDPSA